MSGPRCPPGELAADRCSTTRYRGGERPANSISERAGQTGHSSTPYRSGLCGQATASTCGPGRESAAPGTARPDRRAPRPALVGASGTRLAASVVTLRHISAFYGVVIYMCCSSATGLSATSTSRPTTGLASWNRSMTRRTSPGLTVDGEAGTVTWPVGIDLAPEPLYERARAHPLVAA